MDHTAWNLTTKIIYCEGKIDYIFFKDDRAWFEVEHIEQIRTKVDESWLTDHWALACTLQYQIL
jgi:hypothetical protein